MENLDFLKTKYNLHTSLEAEKAAKRAEKRTGEKIPQKPEACIQNYLDRFKEIIERKNPEKRESGLNALERLLHNKFVIKPEEIPEAAFLLEQRIARELGHGDVEITDEFKEQKTGQIINNQTKSLDKWVDYLASPDAQYPDWAKYWTLRSVLEMGKLQKEQDEQGRETANFQKREKNTVASFPMLNPRALALTIGALRSKLEEKSKPKEEQKPIENKSLKLNEPEFQQLLSTEKFSKIYAQFLIEMPEYSTEGLQETRGKWVKYLKGSEADDLVKSLEGYPLEWCTADFDTAQTQLEGGDFYVYYSINESGEAIIPRLAIRLEDEHIAEARGIAPDQNFDPYIVPVLEDKLKEFGSEGEAYKKKSADMKLLTEIEKKTDSGQELTKDELIFLYEIDHLIKGFGYYSDPRIKDIRERRKSKKDAPIIFECAPEKIAWKKQDVTEKTKVYVGELFPGIFQKDIERVYTSLAENKIQKYNIKIGGQTKDWIKKKIEENQVHINDLTKYLLKSKDFVTLENIKNVNLAILTVKNLGLSNKAPTLDEIYKRAEELGLELCPAEVGPRLQLQMQNFTKDSMRWLQNSLAIAMKQIDDRANYPNIFYLDNSNLLEDNYENNLFLSARNALPSSKWRLNDRFVFSLP